MPTGDTMRLLGFVQLAMGIVALATLPVYGGSFYAMQWLVHSLAPHARPAMPRSTW